jgi:hypothetical protein
MAHVGSAPYPSRRDFGRGSRGTIDALSHCIPMSAHSLRLAVLAAPLLFACSTATSTTTTGSTASAQDDPCVTGFGKCATLPPTPPTSCTSLGSVKFRLVVPSTDGGAYSTTSYAWGGDSYNWFTVSPAGGADLQVMPPASPGPGLDWAASCSACESLATAALFPQTEIEGGSISGTWNGTSYSQTSTCNETRIKIAVPCGDVLCAPAGKYVVKMCAAPPGADPFPSSEECVSVPFDFPGTPEVTGAL